MTLIVLTKPLKIEKTADLISVQIKIIMILKKSVSKKKVS